MKVQSTDLPGVFLIEPRRFDDSRGFFMETFHQQRYTDAGLDLRFVQDNYSRSCRSTVRGLHYQIKHPQGKLVQVLHGEIFDLAVDLRRDSATFGRWFGVTLSETNHLRLYIPPGCAHGFCVMSENADFIYKCTDLYHPEHERTLLWNDPDVRIDWPTLPAEPILSDKDRNGTPFSQIECYEKSPC